MNEQPAEHREFPLAIIRAQKVDISLLRFILGSFVFRILLLFYFSGGGYIRHIGSQTNRRSRSLSGSRPPAVIHKEAASLCPRPSATTTREKIINEEEKKIVFIACSQFSERAHTQGSLEEEENKEKNKEREM